MKQKTTNNDLPKLKVRDESFASGSISFRETEPDSAKWKVIGFHNLDLRDLSRAIFKQLLNEDCRIIKIGNVKLNQRFSEEEIYKELADSISSEKLESIFL